MNRTGISIGLASLSIVAAMAGGCSSSAGQPNRTDAGEVGAPDVGPDVARDLGGPPDVPMDVPMDVPPDVPPDVPMDVPPDRGYEVASPDAGGTDAHDGGTDCHLPIDGPLPFICTSAFDDPSWQHGICDSPGPFAPAVRERLCGGFQSRSFDYGTHRWTCYYDPSTLALVGGEFSNDVPSYCGNTTYYVTAGDVPATSCNNPFVQSPPCPSDGGGQ